MDFSESYKFNGPPPSYSPDGIHIACAQEQRVIVRDVDSLQMIRIFSCLDKVQRLEWSPHSNLLLCILSNRAQVFSLEDQEWNYKIDEGSAGVRNCIWAPDGCSVLVVADFQIRISVHSLVDQSVKLMRGPKYADRAISFSPDGQLLAYAERTDCKEYVSLVSCDTWDLRMRIATTTQDLADLSWSPNSKCFVVWDILLTYKLLVYDSAGRCLASYSAYKDALGIRTIQWSPDGSLLAVGSYDQEVRILSSSNWRPMARLEHSSNIPDDRGIVAYSEVDDPCPPGTSKSRSRYIVCETPLQIQSNKAPPDKANPKIGVAHISWSPDGQFLASRNESMPHTIFIWSIQNNHLRLASVLVQKSPIKSCAWNPRGDRLMISTSGNIVFMWYAEGASCIYIPVHGFNVQSVHWSSRGHALLFADREHFCCAYVKQDE